MTSSSSIVSRDIQFEELVEFLFTQADPIPNSMALDLVFDNDSSSTTTDFLYDLFVNGYKKLYTLDPVSPEEGERRYRQMQKYFQAINFDLHLVNYETDENGNVTNFNVTFSPYLPQPL